jgi:hypothetical protein
MWDLLLRGSLQSLRKDPSVSRGLSGVEAAEEFFPRWQFLLKQLSRRVIARWQITINTFGERLGYCDGGLFD